MNPTDKDTFLAHGFEWRRHIPGHPRPCKAKEVVHVLMRCELKRLEGVEAMAAARWLWSSMPSASESEIIGWRYSNGPAAKISHPQTPPHYSGPVTPWDLEKCMQSSGSVFIDSRRTDAIEYCFRMKGDLLGDLIKARHCLDEAIRVLEASPPPAS